MRRRGLSATPLRDTFAVRKLLSGMAIEDLSRLLGHSSVKITEQYYAKWIRARKTRLERIVAEMLTNSRGDTLGNGRAVVAQT